MVFSSRTPDDLSHNPITRAHEGLKDAPVLDLTQSNPTQCGFEYPLHLLEPLSRAQALRYEPEPFGHPAAREAVARYLSAQGPSVEASQVILTASTSEAYSFIFKLLGNPGDSFLIPTPGYPLLDHLLRLEGLEALPYSFRQEPGWPLNRDSLGAIEKSNSKGVIAVNPHNPTGCFLTGEDEQFLIGFCQKRRCAYLSDEVFSDFRYSAQKTHQKPSSGILSFRLGGLSKSLGLPQLKLSWIVLDGPPGILGDCRERLELIADTYLSVNSPVQGALGDLLEFAPSFQKQVLSRVLANRAFLEKGLEPLAGVKVWPAQAGWYALVELLKPGASDEKLVIELMEKQRVLVQPGGFYDFSHGCFLVLSLLPPAAVFEEGIGRLKKVLEAWA
jgi:aspartate/methionine/tyrosine aminotransferase